MDNFIKELKYSDINGYSSCGGYTILAKSENAVSIIKLIAHMFDLDVSVEEIPASLTVKFFKVIVAQS